MTLNRHLHFKRCIKSLTNNFGSNKTDLFIALDYPFKEDQFFGYNKILEFIDTIKGFRSINVIKRDKNYGIEKNYFESTSEIFSKYDKIVFTEDDNLFSSDFLNFINRCLIVYKDREDIFSISGYQYPIELFPKWDKEVYLWQGYSAWGVGMWKSKWSKIEWSKEIICNSIQQFFTNPNDIIKLNDVANHYIPALLLMLKKKEIHGDGYLSLYQYLNNMYSVFPTISRVRNMGHDGSGVGCGSLENDIYAKQYIYYGFTDYDLPLNIQPNIYINDVLKAHFRKNNLSKCKTAVDIILMKMNLFI